MDRKAIQTEKRLCSCCMEEHEVKTVLVNEQVTFKNVKVNYDALYFYCDTADEFYMDEALMEKNDIALKEAYRKQEGLLTAKQIMAIRAKYGITQGDLCTLLGWGGKTITRYEAHQVQDKAHDMILKKLDRDPEWFLDLLSDAKDSLTLHAYQKYYEKAMKLYEAGRDIHLQKAIEGNAESVAAIMDTLHMDFEEACTALKLPKGNWNAIRFLVYSDYVALTRECE